MNNKILLLTTKNCLGCSVIKKSIEQAINKTSVPIEFEEKDMTDVKKAFLKANNIKDFPTVMFYKDNKCVLLSTGSKPEPVITRWIDIHFK